MGLCGLIDWTIEGVVLAGENVREKKRVASCGYF
jgi:hypothetical protein